MLNIEAGLETISLGIIICSMVTDFVVYLKDLRSFDSRMVGDSLKLWGKSKNC